MTNKALFWSFYVNFCTFCASLRPKRTVFTRLKIKVRPKGLHKSLPPDPWHLTPVLSTLVERTLKKKLFMQNKANFKKVKLNVNRVLTKDYDQMDTWSIRKNEPKTNPNEPKTNPNEPKSKKAKMNVTSIITKDYENMSNWAICENEPNSNPKQTQFKPKQTQFYMILAYLSSRANIYCCVRKLTLGLTLSLNTLTPVIKRIIRLQKKTRIPRKTCEAMTAPEKKDMQGEDRIVYVVIARIYLHAYKAHTGPTGSFF